MKIQVQSKRIYITEDGREFEDIDEARAYTRRLALYRIIERDGVCVGTDMDETALVDWILDTWPELMSLSSGTLEKKK